MRDADISRLAAVAFDQDGLFHIDQAVRLGIGRQAVRRSGSSGALDRVHPAVWRFPATPVTSRQLIRAAVLQVGDGCTASHQSSLVLHGVTNVPFDVAVTVGPEDNHRFAGIRVHRLGDLCEDMVLRIDGIPVTTLPRAVVDVASVFRRQRLGDLVDRLTIDERRTSLGAIDRALRRSNRRGRRGIGALRDLLDERAPVGPTPRSGAERVADELIRHHPVLPRPLCEYPHPGWDPGAAFVDRAWPEAMLILEIDSRSWHGRERQMAKDRARDRSAGTVGWYTARVTYRELCDEPQAVLDDLVAIYQLRVRQLGR